MLKVTPQTTIELLTTTYSQMDVLMNEILTILQDVKNMRELQERLLAAEPNKDSVKAAYHRGSISAYNDVILRFTK